MTRFRTFKKAAFRSWAGPLLILLVQSAAGEVKEQIRPPFGLQWHETEERLEKLLKGAKAQIVERRNVEGRGVWTVEGLVSANLKRTIFYFKNSELVEVELQYQNAEWDTLKYDDFMGQVRRQLEQKYGVGELI